jgi:Flp pilus assembly protein TadD
MPEYNIRQVQCTEAVVLFLVLNRFWVIVVYESVRKISVMTLQQIIANRRTQTGRLRQAMAGVAALMLSACATQTIQTPAPPPLLGAGPAIVIPDVDVLEVTPRMRDFLEHYVLDYDNNDTRRQLLALALTDRSILGFHYNLERTLTAEEAFNTRSGNCIGFANLFIAMARSAGLRARFHEVILPPEWGSRQDTLVNAKHINVIVETAHGPFQVDISGREIRPGAQRKVLDDNEGKALYFNNLAMDQLFEGDLAMAHAYLLKAIETAPQLADAWSNLGVVLGRNEQLADAELAYLTALQIDHAERSAMANLYELYIAQERMDEARELKTRVDRYRRENPYYLLALSDEAMELHQFEESIDLLNRAISKKETEHRLHFALARTQYLSGRKEDAQSSLARARELAPEDEADTYNRPLAELVRTANQSSLD